MKFYRVLRGLAGLAFLASGGILGADVKMSPIFGDHMVLQQGMTLPVWGMADAGENVTVTVGDHTGSAVADSKGQWMVKLAPLSAGTTPVVMTVVGKNSPQVRGCSRWRGLALLRTIEHGDRLHRAG